MGKIKYLIRKYMNKLRKIFSKIFAKLFNIKRWLPKQIYNVALTGELSEQCLEEGALPMLVHYYSPVPDIKDLKARQVWSKRSDLPGIDFRSQFQIDLVKELGKEYGDECAWPENQTNDKREFFTHNGGFSYGCAAVLQTMIRKFKPKNIIEIGSGNSSKIIADALSLNKKESNEKFNYVVIDPYPSDTTRKKIKEITHLIDKRVELVDFKEFEILKENDILFIDSSHTVKIGGDVNFLYLEVLPRLNPGVIVHVHDIPMPYEYSITYATNPTFRMFWTESYLLQAFLTYNSAFEIMLAMSTMQTEHMDVFCDAFQKFDLAKNWSNSGSFWIRRKK
jgi:hypothetical protein